MVTIPLGFLSVFFISNADPSFYPAHLPVKLSLHAMLSKVYLVCETEKTHP